VQRFGYVDTARGQVHYRHAGSGPAVVLLHWGPGSSAQYAGAVDEFAARGFQAIAPDLPGFGQSLRLEGHWSIGDFAACMLECLDGWGLGRCVLVGGHLASLIAMEAADRAPQRFALVVLDGTPAWDEARRREILQRARPVPMTPSEDGAHLQALWQQLLGQVRIWRPGLAWGEQAGRFAMQLVKARLMAGSGPQPTEALLGYDVFAALGRLRVPTLALSADDDPLRDCHDTVLARVAGSTGHVFHGDHPLHSCAGSARYVEPIVARLRALGFVADAAGRTGGQS